MLSYSLFIHLLTLLSEHCTHHTLQVNCGKRGSKSQAERYDCDVLYAPLLQYDFHIAKRRSRSVPQNPARHRQENAFKI